MSGQNMRISIKHKRSLFDDFRSLRHIFILRAYFEANLEINLLIQTLLLDRIGTLYRRKDSNVRKPLSTAATSTTNSIRNKSIATSDDQKEDFLPIHPSQWPQRPLLIRPTPHTSTKILGIRMSTLGKGAETELPLKQFAPFC